VGNAGEGDTGVWTSEKEGARGTGGKVGEVRAGKAGRSSGGEWNVSQEASSAL